MYTIFIIHIIYLLHFNKVTKVHFLLYFFFRGRAESPSTTCKEGIGTAITFIRPKLEERERESESALHLSAGYPTNEFIAQQ